MTGKMILKRRNTSKSTNTCSSHSTTRKEVMLWSSQSTINRKKRRRKGGRGQRRGNREKRKIDKLLEWEEVTTIKRKTKMTSKKLSKQTMFIGHQSCIFLRANSKTGFPLGRSSMDKVTIVQKGIRITYGRNSSMIFSLRRLCLEVETKLNQGDKRGRFQIKKKIVMRSLF